MSFITQVQSLPFVKDVAFHVATDPHEAVHAADIIVTATPATTPLFVGDDVCDGVHINAIGAFTPHMQEVPPELVRRAKVVVDSRQACMAEAGDILIPIREGLIPATHIHAELGELVSGRKPGRTSATEITLFKSVGNAVQDLAVGQLALGRAEHEGIGQMVDFS
jgi:ornithine cyclodeaminase